MANDVKDKKKENPDIEDEKAKDENDQPDTKTDEDSKETAGDANSEKEDVSSNADDTVTDTEDPEKKAEADNTAKANVEQNGDLKTKYEQLLIKDALADAGAEYGLTRKQIPFVARMLDTDGLVNGDTVDTEALASQLKDLISAFPALVSEPEDTKQGFKIGVPVENDTDGETLKEKLLEAAGLK